jgi:hypothetical protein
MTWQQLLIATWMIVGFVFGAYESACDREKSSGEVAIGVLMSIAIYAGLAWVLASGGFW